MSYRLWTVKEKMIVKKNIHLPDKQIAEILGLMGKSGIMRVKKFRWKNRIMKYKIAANSLKQQSL